MDRQTHGKTQTDIQLRREKVNKTKRDGERREKWIILSFLNSASNNILD